VLDISFFLVPETRPGQGTGHFRRALDIARQHQDAYIYLPENHCASWKASFPALLNVPHGSNLPESDQKLLVIIDKPWLNDSEAVFWASFGILVGIDVRGPGTRRCLYMIDMLPRITNPHHPWEAGNLQDNGFLDLADAWVPVSERRQLSADPDAIRSILVSFGGEDAFGQGRHLAGSGFLEKHFPQATVTFVRGARMQLPALPDAWQSLDAPTELKKSLRNYDLVICMFGLTAFEALASGCLVVVWNPTRYHQKLAVKTGFARFKYSKTPQFQHALVAVLDQAVITTAAFKWQDRQTGTHLQKLNFATGSTCPTCRHTRFKVVERFPDRTYKRCDSCAMLSMHLFQKQEITYSEAYFFEEYQKQYGKTYLEDFPHIKNMGKGRLKQIRTAVTPGFLIDVGCAYGPFLSAAHDAGFTVAGIDVSQAAIGHVRKELGFPAAAIDVLSAERSALVGLLPGSELEGISVITMWYVIEHFPDLVPLLKLVNASLKMGGVFAFSTPNGSGISARNNQKTFLERSPKDHYTIWEPQHCKKILGAYGFKIHKIRGAGHHPERFQGLLGHVLLRPLAACISRVFNLADTFEVYATKIREYNS